MRNRLVWIIVGLLLVGIVLQYVLGIKMTRADIHISAAAEPLACLGGERVGEFCSPGTILPITNSLVMTVLVDLVLVLVILLGARNMQLVPRGFQNIVEWVVEGFYNFALGIDRQNIGKFFPLPATIFIFFLVANMLALVPGVGSIGLCVPQAAEAAAAAPAAAEASRSAFTGFPGHCGAGNFIIPFLRAPAADLNVTFAFALSAVFMVEYFGIQALGLSYFSRFFNLKEGALGFFVSLIELVSEISRIVSFAFRIFGNIFGGEVILVVMSFLLAYVLPLPFYGFEVFVAFIQSVIFAVLTLVFMSNAVVAHGAHEEHGPSEVAHGETQAHPA
ncbi:MAG TPA: F0F1 ATP synthase subunit A [Roseiflexaceae bacterium]|nr:F0F1 ATP synthase subunit A [Roseiflexaceae bacterium]